MQVPLKLAWAISIHKSQGMSLPSVEMDLARCFETGHAYVALSRATSLEGARLLSFDPKKVAAHPTVVAFYQGLEAAMNAAGPGASSVSDEPPPISEEQRRRMEANRAAALARRAQAAQAAP